MRDDHEQHSGHRGMCARAGVSRSNVYLAVAALPDTEGWSPGCSLKILTKSSTFILLSATVSVTYEKMYKKLYSKITKEITESQRVSLELIINHSMLRQTVL